MKKAPCANHRYDGISARRISTFRMSIGVSQRRNGPTHWISAGDIAIWIGEITIGAYGALEWVMALLPSAHLAANLVERRESAFPNLEHPPSSRDGRRVTFRTFSRVLAVFGIPLKRVAFYKSIDING